jgi:hypothetical protein
VTFFGRMGLPKKKWEAMKIAKVFVVEFVDEVC